MYNLRKIKKIVFDKHLNRKHKITFFFTDNNLFEIKMILAFLIADYIFFLFIHCLN